MRLREVWILPLGALALVACQPDTVTLGFEPAQGDVFRYRYDIELTLTRVTDGGEPESTELTTSIVSEQRVLEHGSAGTLTRVELSSEGAAPRTATVVLDRAGSLAAIEEIADLPVAEFTLPAGAAVFAAQAAQPPAGALRLGDRWRIDDDMLRGEARLERLGVVDDEHVAVVSTSITESLDEAARSGLSGVDLAGELRTVTSTMFDLHGGAIRRGSSTSSGDIDVLVAPPAGVVADAVPATITYRLIVRTTRLA